LGITLKKNVALLSSLLPIVLLIGIVLSLIPPDVIGDIIGESSGISGILTGIIIGSVGFSPSFVIFPLGAKLINHGAGLYQVAAFVASMMSVGIITLQMEINFFGKKVAVMRNILGLFATIPCVNFTVLMRSFNSNSNNTETLEPELENIEKVIKIKIRVL
jgi:uncharacterized membrane protein YraQ (UPF0718 family)